MRALINYSSTGEIYSIAYGEENPPADNLYMWTDIPEGAYLTEIDVSDPNNHKPIITKNESIDIQDEDLIPEEDIIISLTVNGYIKRVTTDTYRTQNRGGVGVKGMSTNEEDFVEHMIEDELIDVVHSLHQYGSSSMYQ